MRTVLLGPPSSEFARLLDLRKERGQDGFDEVWEGEYHVAPAAHSFHGIVADELRAALRSPAKTAGLRGSEPFNLGTSTDYRVPDGGFFRSVPNDVWVATAAIVIEVVSPDDQTFDKFDFYRNHSVEEIIVADPAARTVRFFSTTDGFTTEVARSTLLNVASAEIADAIDWPGGE